jgi:hypothetical protein
VGIDEIGDRCHGVGDREAVDLVVAVLGGLHDHADGALVIEPLVDQAAQFCFGHARPLGDDCRCGAGVAGEPEPGPRTHVAVRVGTLEHDGHDQLALDREVTVAGQRAVGTLGCD